MGKAKAPKKTPEELALARAQEASLSQTANDIADRRRRIIRAQTGGRGSLLSGGERGVRPGEQRLVRGGGGGPGNAGRTGGYSGTSTGLGGVRTGGASGGGGGGGGAGGGRGRVSLV